MEVRKALQPTFRPLALLSMFSFLLCGQEFRGTILGRVTDPSGAAAVGATVRVVNIETNVASETKVNELGNYQVPFLLPGNYAIAVEHAGFRTLQRNNVRVSIKAEVKLDFVLEIGAAAETVTVTASAPLLNAVNADLGQVIENRYVDAVAGSLAMGRNVLNLSQLAPGVTGTAGSYTSNSQNSFSISGGGSTRGANEVLIDGIPNTVPQRGGMVVFTPSVDSVEEVKVHNTMFDAGYGHSNGGAISITTRSGTNNLHGALYDYKQWSALNANSWSNNRLRLPKPPISYYQWGYTVGGPVYIPYLYNGRNRTFFMTSLERDNDKRSVNTENRVPTTAERAGDFSQTVNAVGGPLTIYDPATTVVAGGKATRQPFPGARIPAAQLNPIGVAILNVFPSPNLPGRAQIGGNNWAAGGIALVVQKQESARIDHAISDRRKLFGRVSQLQRRQTPASFSFPGAWYYPGYDWVQDLRRVFSSASLDDTFVFSPSLVGSLRYGFSRKLEPIVGGSANLDPASLKLPNAIVANQFVKGYPLLSLGENLPQLGNDSQKVANDVHSLLATFTKLAGRHSLKIGLDYRLTRWNQLSPGSAAAGTFSFSPGFTTADPFTASSTNTSGTALASALLAAPSSGSFGYVSPLSLQNHYAAGYVQEDWKLTGRLTLNFGLRYELETPYTERYNRVSYGFDSAAQLPVQVSGVTLRGGLLFAGVGGLPRREGNVDWDNFGPRFGLAYSVGSKTVIRAGYGLFYSGQSFNSSFLGQVNAFDAVTPYVGSIDNGATVFTTLSNPFPNGLRQAPGGSIGLRAQLGDGAAYFAPDRVSPYNQQWMLGVQRELPSQVLVEVAFMGMLSLKEFESFNLNEKPDRYLALGSAENTKVPNPFYGVFPATSSLGQGTTVSQRQLWLAFPQFTSLTVNGANTGRSTYRSLQLKAEKRLTHGLAVSWNYTYSRLLRNNTTSLVNERHYYSISNLDQTHLMRMAFTYKLPIQIQGQGFARLAKQLAEGWSLSGFMSMFSGLPMTISQANGRPIVLRNPALSGPVGERLGDRRDAGGRVANPYFDIGAFQALASQYTISPTLPYLEQLRAPGSNGLPLSLSLFKYFTLKERLKLQARIDATSITNTPQFGAPGTNMSSLATFGVITSASGRRQMQAALRLEF